MELYWAGLDNPKERLMLQRWASQRIYDDPDRLGAASTCMGVIEGEQLVAAICYQNYDPNADVLEYSGAGDTARWLSSNVLHAMFAYPFETVRCQMLVTRNSEHNKRLHRQLKATGHKPHRIERLRGPDEAEIVWTLTKEDWAANKLFQRARRDFDNG